MRFRVEEEEDEEGQGEMKTWDKRRGMEGVKRREEEGGREELGEGK